MDYIWASSVATATIGVVRLVKSPKHDAIPPGDRLDHLDRSGLVLSCLAQSLSPPN